MTDVHDERTWENFINKLDIKRSNFLFDATRVFTFLLNLDLDYKSIILSLCTFTLLLSFLASFWSPGVLHLFLLEINFVETNYNVGLHSLFIRFYNTTPIWTMKWSWPLDGWRILNLIRSWSPWSRRILDHLIFRNKPILNRNWIIFVLHQKKKLAPEKKTDSASETSRIVD